MWHKHMLHTRKKSFYRKLSSLSNKLSTDAGSTLIKIQQESEKKIFIKKFHNVSEFKK